MQVIAVAPTTFRGGSGERERARRVFEPLLVSGLEGGGFTVVGPQAYEAVWQHHLEEAGGVYDPITGERDEGRMERVLRSTSADLSAQLSVDAVLSSAVITVPGPWKSATARWDESKESILGRPVAIFAASTAGVVPALTFSVLVHDTRGRPLYANRGGIQILSKLWMDGFSPIPEADLLACDDRNLRAFLLATRGLRGPPSAEVARCIAAGGRPLECELDERLRERGVVRRCERKPTRPASKVERQRS